MPRNKKAKPVGQSRAKTQSDEAYNARRRAKRAAARIERELARQKEQGKVSAKREASTRSYIANLREQIAQTYSTKRGVITPEQERAIRALDVQTREKGTETAAQRQNVIFERQINLATAEMPSTIAKDVQASKAAVKIFYKATQDIWSGLPSEERNKAIMAALGVSTLREAFMVVMRDNAQAFRAALSAMRPLMSTDEAGFMDEPGIADDIGSPPYLAFVNPVQAARGA